MKYPRGTVLKWTAKALKPRRSPVTGEGQRHPDDRLVVLTADTMILYRWPRIETTDLLKTQDSFVEPANEPMPPGLLYDNSMTLPSLRAYDDDLAQEFKFVIVRM